MTNPDNAVGTNAAYGGRTSVNAFNDDLSAWSRGVMSGWACTPDGGLVVSLGGNGTDRDVAVAEDNVGNKTSINNISGAPIKLTMAAAPGSGTRLDSIVAYVDASPQGEATVVDNYGACGLIVVQGTPSASPVAPTENEIRSAITSDGASGPTAYYVVLATITMASGTTDVTAGEIAAGDTAELLGNGIVTANNIDFTTIVSGIANLGVINSHSGKQATISIPTQKDTNYKVLVSGDGGGSAYSFIAFTVLNKTTTSFVIEGWNNHESASGNIRATYLLIP